MNISAVSVQHRACKIGLSTIHCVLRDTVITYSWSTSCEVETFLLRLSTQTRSMLTMTVQKWRELRPFFEFCSIPPYSSVFSAELIAVALAIHRISSLTAVGDYTIFSDSSPIALFRSCLIGIQETSWCLPFRESSAQRKCITFCWVSFHVGVPGKEGGKACSNQLDKECTEPFSSL